jgi:hypothetical protein
MVFVDLQALGHNLVDASTPVLHFYDERPIFHTQRSCCSLSCSKWPCTSKLSRSFD